MSKCDQDGCTGHLGKFEDCLSEAIWQQSLDGGNASTGTTEYQGHLVLMIYPEPETEKLDDGPTVTIPAGAYIVYSHELGFVRLWKYDSEEAARKEFDEYDERYGEWLDENEPG